MHLRCFEFLARFRCRLICVAPILASLVCLSSSATAEDKSPFPKGPYLQALGPTSVLVRVELAAPAAATLDVSEAGSSVGSGIDSSVAASAKSTSFDDKEVTAFHSIRATGLKPKTNYDYTLRASAQSRKGHFTTAPANDSTDPFSFIVYGDNRTDEVNHAAVVRAISAAKGDFFIHTGDFVQDGASAEDWQTFFAIESTLLRDRCVFSCVGNHELTDGNGAAYLRYFAPAFDRSSLIDGGEGAFPVGEKPPLYGSFRWGNARFFMLNAMDAWDNGNERAWLDAELTRADDEAGVTFRIVVLHHSPWSAGPHGSNVRMTRAHVPGMLAKHKIDLLLAGHDHIYERGFADGLRYMISGGGGAPLYKVNAPLPSTRKVESVFHYVQASVTADSIVFAATRVDGTLVDKCAFTKSSAAWDCDPKPEAAPNENVQSAPNATSASSEPAKTSVSRCACSVVGGACDREGDAFLALGSGLGVIAIVARRRRR